VIATHAKGKIMRVKNVNRYIAQSLALVTSVVLLASGCGSSASSSSSATNALSVGYASCAHCIPMSLIPNKAKDLKLDMHQFQNGNDSLMALMSKKVDVAQVTYGHLVTALNQGSPVVAISGQINGGSDIILSNGMKDKVSPGNWKELSSYIKQKASDGAKLKIGANRGSSQDLQMRAQFSAEGVDVNKDLDFVNISNPADFKNNLVNKQIDLVSAVEPFASGIILSNSGYHFAYPYDQPMGDLTNIILTRDDVIKSKHDALQQFVDANVEVVDGLKGDTSPWVDAVVSKTGLDKAIAQRAVKNARPDYTIKMTKVEQIAKTLKGMGYVQKDVSGQISSHVDYSFLSKATKQSEAQLGK
jgi:ABC-type nitrate/sulfonate/bicarbonate transport system substrate-binding protein